jgi:hypothetical protein
MRSEIMNPVKPETKITVLNIFFTMRRYYTLVNILETIEYENRKHKIIEVPAKINQNLKRIVIKENETFAHGIIQNCNQL